MEDQLDAVARTELQEGWDVVDADGERIGQVAEVHSGSFLIQTGVGRSLEIDFRDIESADDGRVDLAVSGDELTSDLDAAG